jgi:hypothetical protein
MIWTAGKSVPAAPLWALVAFAVVLLIIGYRVGRRQRMSRGLAVTLAIIVALVPVAVVRAMPFTVPFSFVNGTVADANQLNANFTAVDSKIDSLRNQVAIIDGCEFRPRRSDVAWKCDNSQVFGSVDVGAGIGGGGDAFDNYLVAPVHVPKGATISRIDVHVYNQFATTTMTACLHARLNDSFTNVNATVSCVSSLGNASSGFQTLTLTPSVVQGDAAGTTYQILVTSDAWATIGGVRVANVTYELP